MTELISKNLQRYFDNKDKYNTRAKEYFNNIYYIQNRKAILEKQRLENIKKPKKEKAKAKQIYTSNNNNLIACFD